MKKLGFLAFAIALCGIASAQTLYIANKGIKDQGIALKGWGSGTISETDETAFEGVYSLRISTRNYFQGGILNLASPVDLSTAAADKNNLLRFAIRSSGDKPVAINAGGGLAGAGGAASGPGRSGGGLAGAGGAGGGGGETGGGAGGGGGRQGGGRLGGGAGGGSTPAVATSDAILKTLRLVITTTDGKKSEAYMSVKATGAEAWRSFSLPINAIAGFNKTNKTISSIAVSGDATATFYVGDIRVINDTTPITGEMSQKNDMNLALNDERDFTGYGFAGSTPLRYTWDFDDKDGIQVDAEGQTIKHKFRKQGTFTVTLTISDLYGNKPAYTRTIKVTVNP